MAEYADRMKKKDRSFFLKRFSPVANESLSRILEYEV